MEVRITGRHGGLTEELEEYAYEKLAPLDRYNRHTRSIEVVLDEDNLAKSVEVIAHLDRGAPVVVHARHEDARAAIDLAHDKIERALRRHKERLEGRRHARGEGLVILPAAEESAEDAGAEATDEEE